MHPFLKHVSVYSSYAEVVVSTEVSLNRLLDTMPQCKINGEKVECRHVSRRSLAEFEALARKRKWPSARNVLQSFLVVKVRGMQIDWCLSKQEYLYVRIMRVTRRELKWGAHSLPLHQTCRLYLYLWCFLQPNPLSSCPHFIALSPLLLFLFLLFLVLLLPSSIHPYLTHTSQTHTFPVHTFPTPKPKTHTHPRYTSTLPSSPRILRHAAATTTEKQEQCSASRGEENLRLV